MGFDDAISPTLERESWEGEWMREERSASTLHAEQENGRPARSKKAWRSRTCRLPRPEASPKAAAAAIARQHSLMQLMEAAAAGSDAATAQLYKQTATCLFGVALRITGRRDWAEEVLQEAFISIVSNLKRFDRTVGSPMTWCTAIVRNRALDWRRRPVVDEGCDEFEVLLHTKADHVGGPEEALMIKQSKRSLEACLMELPMLQRRAIVLAYWHGLSHKEIAAQMQFPLGTTKTWIRRGLQRLKRRMHEEA